MPENTLYYGDEDLDSWRTANLDVTPDAGNLAQDW